MQSSVMDRRRDGAVDRRRCSLPAVLRIGGGGSRSDPELSAGGAGGLGIFVGACYRPAPTPNGPSSRARDGYLAAEWALFPFATERASIG